MHRLSSFKSDVSSAEEKPRPGVRLGELTGP